MCNIEHLMSSWLRKSLIVKNNSDKENKYIWFTKVYSLSEIGEYIVRKAPKAFLI